jgi:hypothetical protein
LNTPVSSFLKLFPIIYNKKNAEKLISAFLILTIFLVN